MNRQEWEEQVFESDLNPTARVVCLAVGSHGNWTSDREVRPSKKRISGMTGLSREYAGHYIDALEEQGWLRYTGTTSNRVKVFTFGTPTKPAEGILAVKRRGSTKGLNNQVVVDYDNQGDEQVVVVADEVVVDYDNQVVVDAEQVVVNYDTNLKNLQVEPKEPTTTSTTDKSAVQQSKEHSLGEAVPTSLNESLGEGERTVEEIELPLNGTIPASPKTIKTPRAGFGTGPSWKEQAAEIDEEW